MSRKTFNLIATLLALAIFVISVRQGAFIAGGADSYGYLSQARLWADGKLIVRQRIAAQVSWPDADATFTPLGYVPYRESGAIVPAYPPGYPLVMALARLVFGAGSEFYVVPALAALTVVATYVAASSLVGPWGGLLAALLMATSPTFIFQSLQPMSDVPATLWWALAAALALSNSAFKRSFAGVATFVAILTRPNLALLAIPILAMVYFTARRYRRSAWIPPECLVTAVAVAAGVAVILYLNHYLYGSIARSGYGTADYLYKLGNAKLTVPSYLQWLISAETPFVLLSAAALRVPRDALNKRHVSVGFAAMIAVVWLSYAFYSRFEDWTYLRFLLPSFPFMFALLMASGSVLLSRNPVRPSAAMTWLCAVIVAWHVTVIVQHDMLTSLKKSESRYALVGQYVRLHLPESAVVVSALHSGSIRYYSGRMTLRYDLIPPELFDTAMKELSTLGRQPFLVLDSDEPALFQKRLSGFSAFAQLDWYPMTTVPGDVGVYYVPLDRLSTLDGSRMKRE